jgi:flagellar biosynthesis chaperone FliJ
MPELVRLVEDPRSDNGTDSTKSVIYQDLIAVLTMVLQEQTGHINKLEAKFESLDERLKRLEGQGNLTIFN